MEKIINKTVDTLRVLSAETISHSNSGHSGIALGAAPIMYATYASMRVDPANPSWFNRDRFVMSAGHGSALLYSTLNMFGFPIQKDDLKTFRKLGSKLHGHPELFPELGIDASTGPLGQGIAMAVGIALAEKKLSATYNRDKLSMVDHYTYCLVGDGCLMEGVSYEACNLAGLWQLNKLIVLYDANEITLDGTRASADGEDIVKRFMACGWNVLAVDKADTATPILDALKKAKRSKTKPTLIVCRTTIGYGSSTAGTAKAHGQVLTTDEIMGLRKSWGLKGELFAIDKDVEEHMSTIIKGKTGVSKKWKIKKYKREFPTEYANLVQFYEVKKKPAQYNLNANKKPMALRDAGHEMLQQMHAQNPRLVGANADISSTTKAFIKGGGIWAVDNQTATDIACGVREHAMAAIANGLALHGYMLYCSTFLAFSDYLKPALRLSSLMNLPVHYIFSHDGIGNPPDGPTHQANEHITALRIVPNMHVFRPCNDVETAQTFKWIYESGKPSTTIVSRSGGTYPTYSDNADVTKGGYLVKSVDNPQATILATGLEVELAMDVGEMLAKESIHVNVASMPCLELFNVQSGAYKKSVLGKAPRVAIEMGNGIIWHKYVGDKGSIISFDEFGKSAGEKELREHLGFTTENVVKVIKEMLEK
ncbi:MAG: transketolase [Firmicutes bacterium]|nr:transketolase [Bacillota bacterium]